jgi:lipooligosaccharide transport system permease protein
MAAQVLPLTHAVDLVRPLLIGEMPANILLHVGFLTLITTVAFLVARRLARRRLLK